MRIGMVLANHRFPPDIRVEKEAQVLSGEGHEISVLCRREPGQAEIETVGHAQAVRHRVHSSSSLRRRLDSLIYLLTLDSPSWRRAMVDLVQAHHAGAIHVHDLPYAKCGIKAAREAGVPVVIDLHENHPAALALWKRRAIDRMLLSPTRASRLERWAVRHADAVIVVVEEAKDRLIADGADPAKIVVFGNTESRELAALPTPAPTWEALRMVYVGGVAQHRGLDTAVRAMPEILREQPTAHLTIVGDGDAMDALRTLVADLSVAESVTFAGWLSRDEAMSHIAESTVALVPHHRSPHTDATIPHKLFQYMAYARPVLVSDCAPLARIVRETGAGEVFASGNAHDLASKALLLADPGRAASAGAAGRAAVLDRYNLEVDGVVLADLYDRLAARSGRTGRS